MAKNGNGFPALLAAVPRRPQERRLVQRVLQCLRRRELRRPACRDSRVAALAGRA